MASVFLFCEDTGLATNLPVRGTGRFFNVGDVNWKNVDSTGELYSNWPITAGNNSFRKYQFGLWTGSFNSVSNVLFNHTTGSFVQPGFTLVFTGTSGYAAPSTTTLVGADLTLTGLVSTGLSLLLGTGGPQSAAVTTLNSSGYSAYVVSQLQTTASAGPGDTPSISYTISWSEN